MSVLGRRSRTSFNSLAAYNQHLRNEYFMLLKSVMSNPAAAMLRGSVEELGREQNAKGSCLLHLNDFERQLQALTLTKEQLTKVLEKKSFDAEMLREGNRKECVLMAKLLQEKREIGSVQKEVEKEGEGVTQQVWRIHAELEKVKDKLMDLGERREFLREQSEEMNSSIREQLFKNNRVQIEIENREEEVRRKEDEIEDILRRQIGWMRQYQELRKRQIEFRKINRENREKVEENQMEEKYMKNECYRLENQLYEKQMQLEGEKGEIMQLQDKIEIEQIRMEENQNNLEELKRYLKILRQEQQKLKIVISQVIAQDDDIHSVIGRKKSMKFGAEVSNKKEQFNSTANSSSGFNRCKKFIRIQV